MNCKPGDLAVVVKSERHPQSIGWIVNVVQPYAGGFLGLADWVVTHDRPLNGWYESFIPDEWLRPIRDNDGEDETLTWAGKPEGVPQCTS